MGILYIVSTPIGNLQDITLRVIDIIKETEYIACEDTRKTGFLIKSLSEKFGSFGEKFLFSVYEENEVKRIPEVLNVLQNGKNVVLVSDAGTPLISDPGFKLVRKCIIQGIRVESIPGPSSVISALVVSGLPSDKFTFVGFLPKKPGHRLTLLKNLHQSLELIKSTVILFESPFRLVKTLGELQTVFGDRDVVVVRELTKIHEEVKRGKITEMEIHFKKTSPKGEIVILF
ncbi:MAG TPA: 16S rRNA (cytidine(1402)-2'-O)-methyltransferase [Patescibacteria group bacterium]|jgi:16S rRNA (cytidine1402-2'-O)-methyltransferase|nr:16S rRNA (cytidine(1402)-2'-O)-methyltransferase [Patescibacteria group bacterium]